MSKLVWCIPNFSEGRRREVMERIVEAIREAAPVRVLDWSMDTDHNRSVVTFVGKPEDVGSAMFEGAKAAVELIDLNAHKGGHPRMGAVDVIPVVPIGQTTMDDCIDLGHGIGRQIAERLAVPVYFYEECALRDEHRSLARVRRGGFEALKDQELVGKRAPDVGPNRVHPTAGATVVGARGPLIAFNVNLDSDDIAAARLIAREMRELRDSGKGLPGVRAIGVFLASRGIAQISTNITRPDLVTMRQVYDVVERRARSMGIETLESEIIGVVSESAWDDSLRSDLKLKDFADERIIERALSTGP